MGSFHTAVCEDGDVPEEQDLDAAGTDWMGMKKWKIFWLVTKEKQQNFSPWTALQSHCPRAQSRVIFNGIVIWCFLVKCSLQGQRMEIQNVR